MNGTPVTVSASATIVAAAGIGEALTPASIILKVPTGGADVYIGGPTVSGASDGFKLAAGESLQIDLVGEPIYACTTTSTQSVQRLRSRV